MADKNPPAPVPPAKGPPKRKRPPKNQRQPKDWSEQVESQEHHERTQPKKGEHKGRKPPPDPEFKPGSFPVLFNASTGDWENIGPNT